MMRHEMQVVRRFVALVRRVLPGGKASTHLTNYDTQIGVALRLGRQMHGARIGSRARRAPSFGMVRRTVSILQKNTRRRG